MKSYVHRAALSFALTIGSLGAAAFIICQRLGLPDARYILWVYGAFFIVTAIALYFWKFRRYTYRFIAGFGAFSVAALTSYIYLIIDRQIVTVISPFGHLWRIAFLLLMGASINLILVAISAAIKLVRLYLSSDSPIDQDITYLAHRR